MKRGEVWRINLDPTIGSEIKKTRPAVIVSYDAIGVLPLKVIVPLTEWKDRYSAAAWLVNIQASAQSGLRKESAADTFRVRSVSEKRFVKRLGRLSQDDMAAIALGLVTSLGLD